MQIHQEELYTNAIREALLSDMLNVYRNNNTIRNQNRNFQIISNKKYGLRLAQRQMADGYRIA